MYIFIVANIVYHRNPQTGLIGECNAQIPENCPFFELGEHFSNKKYAEFYTDIKNEIEESFTFSEKSLKNSIFIESQTFDKGLNVEKGWLKLSDGSYLVGSNTNIGLIYEYKENFLGIKKWKKREVDFEYDEYKKIMEITSLKNAMQGSYKYPYNKNFPVTKDSFEFGTITKEFGESINATRTFDEYKYEKTPIEGLYKIEKKTTQLQMGKHVGFRSTTSYEWVDKKRLRTQYLDFRIKVYTDFLPNMTTWKCHIIGGKHLKTPYGIVKSFEDGYLTTTDDKKIKITDEPSLRQYTLGFEALSFIQIRSKNIPEENLYQGGKFEFNKDGKRILILPCSENIEGLCFYEEWKKEDKQYPSKKFAFWLSDEIKQKFLEGASI